MAFQSPSDMSASICTGCWPALLTRMSTPPKCEIACATRLGRTLARRDIGLAGGRLAACRPDRLGDRFGGLPVAVVVADDIGAGLAEAPGDAGADAAACAGDDGGSAGEVREAKRRVVRQS